jgi:Domain of unknown function (DUF3883)
MPDDWTNAENEAIVKDYFAMLREELLGRPYNKAEHRRALVPMLNNRSKGAVEWKHRNISAVLAGTNRIYIEGYMPAENVQAELADVIENIVDTDAFFEELADVPMLNPVAAPGVVVPLGQLFEPPPERIVIPSSPSAEPWNSRRGRRIDFAERDARNRRLAKLGEEFVLEVERRRLIEARRDDLARRVEWVSETRGDGVGYDILSFNQNTDIEMLIEVKTTGAPKYTSFYVSRNEVRCSEAMRDQYHLYRLFNFSAIPGLYALHGSLRDTCYLDPTQYEARFVRPQP